MPGQNVAGKPLIIVESKAKIKTLKSLLGNGFEIEASVGHVRDLPKARIGIDIEHGFEPTYEVSADRRAVMAHLRSAASRAPQVYLASDPDREGEAIAWHISEALKLDAPLRVSFNELTGGAVRAAILAPRTINMPLVEAQETRRILDRLVGYKLSPLLRSKVTSNASAGRVQSVAQRLVVDREREIQAFVPQEYWSVTARLRPQAPEAPTEFDARCVQPGGAWERNLTGDEARAVVDRVRGAEFTVSGVKITRGAKLNTRPPFITSTLQQEASRKLGFNAKRTMSAAQALYEGVALGPEGSVGLITYMRTDSVRVAEEAQTQARELITQQYGERYLPVAPPRYTNRESAQDAHEAIRPTSVFRTPDQMDAFISGDQAKLYRLIWQRFVASQMGPELSDKTRIDIAANGVPFRATGKVVTFDGFRRVYEEGRDTQARTEEDDPPLPPLVEGQKLDLRQIEPAQSFTKPPDRYTEATLVKALEEKGIGRPSTYASIISKIQEREYVVQRQRKFHATEMGMTVCDLLVEHFGGIVDVGFTAQMETQLDAISETRADRVAVLNAFWIPFKETLDRAKAAMPRVKPEAVPTDHICPACQKPLVRRQGRLGEFLGCSGYPKCKTVLNIGPDGSPVPQPPRPEPVVSSEKCPKCGKAMHEREGRFGKFLGCSAYPKCKTIVKLPGDTKPVAATEPTGFPCRSCGKGEIVRKDGRFGAFFACSTAPKCKFSTRLAPNGRVCPECEGSLGVGKAGRGTSVMVRCSNTDCTFTEPLEGADNA